jgi:nitrogen regulatory protein P-II 1
VVKIELVTADKNEDEVVGIIQQKACTQHQGDGIIYSSTIDKAISIRTGEEGEAAV